MASRFQNFVESIVYAGMKPGARPGHGGAAEKRGLLARWLSGPAPSDPLYLTNQTFSQKARRLLLVLVPLVVTAAGVIVTIGILSSRTTKAPRELTPAEVAAKVLPGFSTDIKLDSNKDLEVMEVHFESNGGTRMVGNIKNVTDHKITQATVVFDLADASLSRLGAITVTETDLAPGAVRAFKKSIDQTSAAFGLVREVQTR